MTEPTPYHRADREPSRRPWLSDHADRQLRHDLDSLPELVALLDANRRPLRKGEPGPRPTPGSRPPLSLAAVSYLDQRTRQDDTDVMGLAHLERTAGRRDGIGPTIRSWVILAEGEMLDDGQRPTPIPDEQGVASDCAWLARHIVWITEQQWVRELADVVRRAVRDCEQHLHIRPEYRPRCTAEGCRGKLVQHPGFWACPKCGRDYRDERMMLAVQEPMSAERIGTAFGISPSTIRGWKDRGHLQPAEDGPRPRYHVLDVLRLADLRGVDSA